jgi:predicted FMN-binding regulatory protein PaiB
VDRVEAKAKLNQNKSEADRTGVMSDLAERSGGASAIARLMRSGEFDRPRA